MAKEAASGSAHYSIRANSVHSGVIEPRMIAQEDTIDAIKEFAKYISTRRAAKTEEVSNLVLYQLPMNQVTVLDLSLLLVED